MAHDVFISYSSKDKIIADALCHTIEQEGIRCWISPRDVIAGHNYASDLTQGIENCKCFILIFSKNSNESPHVMNELTLAFSCQKTILPFKIENSKMNETFEYILCNKQWIIAFPPPAQKYFQEIINNLKKYLSREGNEEFILSFIPTKTRNRFCPLLKSCVIMATEYIVKVKWKPDANGRKT